MKLLSNRFQNDSDLPQTKTQTSDGSIKLMDNVQTKENAEGTVLYIGSLHTDVLKSVEYLGLEITKGFGDNDGSYENIKYFSCPPKKGLFIQRNQVRQILSTMGRQELAIRSRQQKHIPVKETPGGTQPRSGITRGASTSSKSSIKLKPFPIGTKVLFSFVKDWFPATIEQHVGRELVLLKVTSTEKTKQIRLENQVYQVHVNRLRQIGADLPPLPRSRRIAQSGGHKFQAVSKKKQKHHSKPMSKKRVPEEYSKSISKKRKPEESSKVNRGSSNRQRSYNAKKKIPDPVFSRHNSGKSSKSEEATEAADDLPVPADHPFGDHPAIEDLNTAKALHKAGDTEAAISIFRDVIAQFQKAVYEVRNMSQKNQRRTYLAKLRRHVDDLMASGSSKVVLDDSRSDSQRKRRKTYDEQSNYDRSRSKPKVSAPNSRKKRAFSEQDKAFRDRLANDMVDRSPDVRFSDVLGLLLCKLALYESVVLPSLNPQLFTGLRKPPKGILLFGPPGNGKTMIAKAVATECDATFFGVSASTITSKWVGDQERLMRNLFQMAREQGPSIIFMDEVDSLLTSRGKKNEHESSRRVKTEFLVQIDGIHTTDEDPSKRVLVIAATNLPHQIDDAVLRRFQKRIPVPMPDALTRQHVILKLLEACESDLANDELEMLVFQTEGYSCSDLSQLTQEAAMGPIRDVGLMAKTISPDSLGSIKYKHFEKALETVRPSVPKATVQICDNWAEQYGSKISLKVKDLPQQMISSVEKAGFV